MSVRSNAHDRIVRAAAVITVEHVRDLALFASFSEDDLGDIVSKSAELRVLAGEYVVLDGRMEITKRVGTDLTRCRCVRECASDRRLSRDATRIRASAKSCWMRCAIVCNISASVRRSRRPAVVVFRHRWDIAQSRPSRISHRGRSAFATTFSRNRHLRRSLSDRAAGRWNAASASLDTRTRDRGEPADKAIEWHVRCDRDRRGPAGLASAVYGASEGLHTPA